MLGPVIPFQISHRNEPPVLISSSENKDRKRPIDSSSVWCPLAISRLGAIHTVVFGGCAPASLAQRIEASRRDL